MAPVPSIAMETQTRVESVMHYRNIPRMQTSAQETKPHPLQTKSLGHRHYRTVLRRLHLSPERRYQGFTCRVEPAANVCNSSLLMLIFSVAAFLYCCSLHCNADDYPHQELLLLLRKCWSRKPVVCAQKASDNTG